MLGGQRARRKSVDARLVSNFRPGCGDTMNSLGGPEIYSVPSKALTAGLPGNRTAKILDVRLEVGGLIAAL